MEREDDTLKPSVAREIFRLEKEDPFEHIPPGMAVNAILEAVAEEREACAKVAESFRRESYADYAPLTTLRIAEAIRARGKVTP